MWEGAHPTRPPAPSTTSSSDSSSIQPPLLPCPASLALPLREPPAILLLPCLTLPERPPTTNQGRPRKESEINLQGQDTQLKKRNRTESISFVVRSMFMTFWLVTFVQLGSDRVTL